VVDATFRRETERRRFTDALGADAPPVLYAECRAPRRVLLERARQREREPSRESDATAELVDRQLREHKALDEVDAARHLTLRSDRAPDEIVEDLEALVDDRMAASGGASSAPA
jgi:predicted kinase